MNENSKCALRILYLKRVKNKISIYLSAFSSYTLQAKVSLIQKKSNFSH